MHLKRAGKSHIVRRGFTCQGVSKKLLEYTLLPVQSSAKAQRTANWKTAMEVCFISRSRSDSVRLTHVSRHVSTSQSAAKLVQNGSTKQCRPQSAEPRKGTPHPKHICSLGGHSVGNKLYPPSREPMKTCLAHCTHRDAARGMPVLSRDHGWFGVAREFRNWLSFLWTHTRLEQGKNTKRKTTPNRNTELDFQRDEFITELLGDTIVARWNGSNVIATSLNNRVCLAVCPTPSQRCEII